MAIYNIHGGHNPSGKIACGASDLLDESREDRKICKEVVRLLKKKGHKAYNCTVSNGTSQNDVLKKICAKCNKRKAALDVSIHLNSGRNDRKGDKKIAGTEIWCTKEEGIKKAAGNRILANMKKLGFTNRGIKTTGGYIILIIQSIKQSLLRCVSLMMKMIIIFTRRLVIKRSQKRLLMVSQGKEK